MISRFLTLIPCLMAIAPPARAGGVPVGQSTLIATPDFSDTFTLGTGTRTELPAGAYPVGSAVPEALNLENTHGNPAVEWSDGLWSLNDDATALDGAVPYPGSSGGGSESGMTQTGGAVDAGIEYDLRENFVVQFDAVQTSDRINITAGGQRDSIASDQNPASISVFFRRDGHPELPEVGIYNAAYGEVDAGFDTGPAGLAEGQWNNYAVQFILPERKLVIFANQVELGTVDLTTFGGEAVQGRGPVEPGSYASLIDDFTNDAISVGGFGGDRMWMDNFQVGPPAVTDAPSISVAISQIVRDTKDTPAPEDDTYGFTAFIDGRGTLSPQGWILVLPAGVSGPASGAYQTSANYSGIPVSPAGITLTFSDAGNAAVSRDVTVPAPELPPEISAFGVPVGESSLIGTLDIGETFTLGTGTRTDLPANAFPIGGSFPEALAVESTFGNPGMFWSDERWSLSDDASALSGVPAYPGSSGMGSSTGMTQTGSAVDYGIEYGLRNDFVVQFDAVQTPDRIDLTIGDTRDSIAGPACPSGISLFFRADGHADLPEVGIYNDAYGEVPVPIDVAPAGVAIGEWHNYAARFQLAEKRITVYIDEIELGSIDLQTFGGEAIQDRGTVEPGSFAGLITEFTNAAISVGGAGGNRVWTDNFQVGAPAGAPDPNADSDADGMTDAMELIAGTNPVDSGSILRFTSVVSLASGDIEFRFPSAAGRFYRLYSTADMVNWTRVDTVPVSAGTGMELILMIPSQPDAHRFFRLAVSPVDAFPATLP